MKFKNPFVLSIFSVLMVFGPINAQGVEKTKNYELLCKSKIDIPQIFNSPNLEDLSIKDMSKFSDLGIFRNMTLYANKHEIKDNIQFLIGTLITYRQYPLSFYLGKPKDKLYENFLIAAEWDCKAKNTKMHL